MYKEFLSDQNASMVKEVKESHIFHKTKAKHKTKQCVKIIHSTSLI